MDSVFSLTRKCAECGKEFACHPDVHAWALNVKSVRSYYCSYHCMRAVEKRMQAASGGKEAKRQKWERQVENAKAKLAELLAIRNGPEWGTLDGKKRSSVAGMITNTRKRLEALEDDQP